MGGIKVEGLQSSLVLGNFYCINALHYMLVRGEAKTTHYEFAF